MLMSRPPTLASIVDFLTTDLLVEEQIMATEAAFAHVRNYRLQREHLEDNRVLPHSDQIAVRHLMHDLVSQVERTERLHAHQQKRKVYHHHRCLCLGISLNGSPWQKWLGPDGLTPPVSPLSTSHSCVVDNEASIEVSMATMSDTSSKSQAIASSGRVAKKVPRSSYPLQDPVRYCQCGVANDITKWYISCDECESWFHGRCADFRDEHADHVHTFICPECRIRTGKKSVLKGSFLGVVSETLTLSENGCPIKDIDANDKLLQYRDAMDCMAS